MATGNKKQSDNSKSVAGIVMFRYFPYWPLFLLLMIMFGVGGWAYVKYYSIPVYRSTASILVKDERKGAEESRIDQELNSANSKKIVENEMEVIRSKELLRQVVDNLSLYAPVYQEGHVKSVSAYSASPIVIEAKDLDNIASQKKVYFSYDDTKKEVIVGKNKYLIDQWVTTPFGVLKFKKNTRQLYADTRPLYFSLLKPSLKAAGLSYDLRVGAPNKLSSVINLTLDDEVPARGKDILNELIRVYNESAINNKNAMARQTLTLLDERIGLVEKQIDSIEQSVQRYKSNNRIVDLSEQGKSLLTNFGDNDKKLTDINSQLTVLDEIEKYVQTKDKGGSGGSIVPGTLGINDPTISKLLERLYTAELQYEKLKGTTAENNPVLASVTREIEKIRPNILEAISSQRRSLTASKGNLSSTNNNYSSILQTIPEKERELLEISRQKAIKNEVYSFLLKKREETQLTFASAVPDSQIVDRAESSAEPVSPKKMVIYLSCVIMALLCGVGYVSMREFLTNKITFRSEIEDYTSVPVIAEITHITKKNIFSGSKKVAKMAVAEQFRQLRMALKMYRKQTTKKRLMITSSIGGEGKSFVSGNLAKSIASSGKKVILIDFDMRNPKTSTLFNLVDKAGIKEYLDDEVKAEDIIQKTEYENLYVIPAGGSAVNPTELLLGPKLGELFIYLENNFDYIIADTAPIQPVTDAYIISEFCDTTLYVVRHRYTPKAMIQMLDENNKIKALKNLNIVFNGVRMRGILSKNIGYGYGYGYGYEYGYADRKYIGQIGKE